MNFPRRKEDIPHYQHCMCIPTPWPESNHSFQWQGTEIPYHFHLFIVKKQWDSVRWCRRRLSLYCICERLVYEAGMCWSIRLTPGDGDGDGIGEEGSFFLDVRPCISTREMWMVEMKMIP